MPYVIIAFVIVACVTYGVFKSNPRRVAKNAGKAQQPFRYGYFRRVTRLGRPGVQSDEQRAEIMEANRDQYDPSLDRLDPRNKNYQGPDTAGS